jgi:hypothetical protein
MKFNFEDRDGGGNAPKMHISKIELLGARRLDGLCLSTTITHG